MQSSVLYRLDENSSDEGEEGPILRGLSQVTKNTVNDSVVKAQRVKFVNKIQQQKVQNKQPEPQKQKPPAKKKQSQIRVTEPEDS